LKAAPDLPSFTYLALGAGHAPLQVPRQYIDRYHQWQIGETYWLRKKDDLPKDSDVPGGGAIAKLGDNEYRVTAQSARLTFGLAKGVKGRSMIFDRVEEGRFVKGEWMMSRIWNGDQTDCGFNFTDQPVVLKVHLATYTH